MAKAKDSKYYINNRDFTNEIIRCKHGLFNEETGYQHVAGELSPKAIDYFIILANRAILKLRFSNPLDKEDCIQSALLDLLRYWKNFNEEKLKHRITQLLKERDSILEKSTKERIRYSQIIAMTIDAFIQYTLKVKIEVDHIFCDEAGYMSNIKALTLFKNDCPITFLGDHMQLPPVSEVKNDDVKAMKNSFLYSQSSLFFESMFLRENEDLLYKEFLNQTLPKYEKTIQISLKLTHRFGLNLASVLDKFVYKFGFESALNHDTQLLFIDSNSDSNDATERSSIQEALIIKELVKKFEGKSFAILTPYKKQVKILKEVLGRKYFENIMTIHKSQGSEWDNVIFSVVDDSNFGKRKMFFTNSLNHNFKSLNLINTVVSRAKKRLIIVANEEFWIGQNETQLIGNLINISKKVST